MNEKTIDRRVARTKRMIKDAFVALLNEKTFEEITVNNLTEKADINRGTFYLHYKDKFELLEQCENEIISGIKNYISESEEINPIEHFQNNKLNPPLFFVKLLEYIGQNASFIKLVLNPKANPSFKNKLEKVIREIALQNFESKFDKKKVDIPFEYLVVYFLNNYIGFIQHWINTEMRIDPEETAKIMFKLIGFGANGFVKSFE